MCRVAALRMRSHKLAVQVVLHIRVPVVNIKWPDDRVYVYQ